jgi:hypothetical protein
MNFSLSTRVPVLVAVLLGTLHGCASTQMESTLNPDASTRSYRRVLVEFHLTELEDRELVEDVFAEGSTPGTIFVPSHTVFIPGTRYREADFIRLLKEHEIEAILRSGLVAARSESGLVEGATMSYPSARFELSLVDTEDGVTVWRSTAETEGNPLANWDDLLRSLARKTIDQLGKDGLIR